MDSNGDCLPSGFSAYVGCWPAEGGGGGVTWRLEDSSVAMRLHSLRTEKETFSFSFFLLHDICRTILCWFWPCTTMSRSRVYLCPHPLEPPWHLPTRPTAPSTGVSSLHHTAAPPAGCFTYANAHASTLLHQRVPRSRSTPCPQICSLCLRLHCCQKETFLRTKL